MEKDIEVLKRDLLRGRKHDDDMLEVYHHMLKKAEPVDRLEMEQCFDILRNYYLACTPINGHGGWNEGDLKTADYMASQLVIGLLDYFHLKNDDQRLSACKLGVQLAAELR